MTHLHLAPGKNTGRLLLPPMLLLPVLLPVLLLLASAFLLTIVPHDIPNGTTEDRTLTTAFVTAHDTINGEVITDPHLIRRIEQIAAAVPAHLLMPHLSGARIRYVAQGFGSGDQAPIFHGVFRHPAAALAFGCALDDDLNNRCGITPVAVESAAYEEMPGIRCVPMRLALGASAYEPDRCGASG